MFDLPVPERKQNLLSKGPDTTRKPRRCVPKQSLWGVVCVRVCVCACTKPLHTLCMKLRLAFLGDALVAGPASKPSFPSTATIYL